MKLFGTLLIINYKLSARTRKPRGKKKDPPEAGRANKSVKEKAMGVIFCLTDRLPVLPVHI
jgi:hypothetical protein